MSTPRASSHQSLHRPGTGQISDSATEIGRDARRNRIARTRFWLLEIAFAPALTDAARTRR